MSTWFRRLYQVAWPLWFKLLIGFIVAVLIPLLLSLVLSLNTMQQVGGENAQQFLVETSTQQARALSTALNLAQGVLTSYVQNEDNLFRLRSALPTAAEAVVNPVDEANLAVDFQNQLLNVSGSFYQQIHLLAADGSVRIQADSAGVVVGGGNLANSPAYQLGVEAARNNAPQVLSITVDADNQPLLEVVNILAVTVPGVRDKVVIGYLIGQLKAQSLVMDTLMIGRNDFAVRSRLLTRSGLRIDSSGAYTDGLQTVSPNLLDAALNGRPQIEVIGGVGALLRYYMPVQDTPFVLVVEGASAGAAQRYVSFLLERSFALVLGMVFLVAVLALLAHQLLSPPLRRITQAVQGVTRGQFDLPLPDVGRRDEIGELAGSVADMRKRVLDLVREMELRMETRARDVAATREISHAAATQRDAQQLMDQVVNLIVQHFPNIYHAQIFLLDADGQYAVLRASTGEVGRRLLMRGHRLAVGSVSVVGRASGTGEIVVARNTATSGVHRRNELLPDTLAELAMPLRVGNRVIGVLDVQSKQIDTFDAEQMEVLQTMADQVAIAIENARLYAESVRRLQELERTRRASTLQAWHDYIDSLRVPHLESAAGLTLSVEDHADLRREALARGEVVVGARTARQTIPVAVPIRLRGQLLGAVEWEVPEAEFEQNKIQLAQELAARLAVNLENARLFQESQRAIQRERLVNEISTRLTAQNSVEEILHTAVREVGMALRAPQVSIRLNQSANGHSISSDGE
jgi:GAF domain-containing protein/HAMP domain-containing protein